MGQRPPNPPLPSVLLIGTLDTKGAELGWVAGELRRLGCRVLVLDSGVGGEPAGTEADIPREEVAAAAGETLETLRPATRGDALARMAEGVREVTLRLASRGEIDAALCIGGAGASLAVPAFQALPLGFPKLIVTPLASGRRTFEIYVGSSDVAVMHSVADIMGVNPITRAVFAEAAAYVAGAAHARRQALAGPSADGNGGTRPMIAASMNGNTTPALMRARERLAERGYDVVAFHSNGVGGRAMEQLVRQGRFAAVLDYTTTEVAGDLLDGPMGAGPTRMEAAGEQGVPQVVVPGCIDFITTGPLDETRAAYPERVLYPHNTSFTLVRLTPAEMRELGRVFARKLNAARGPTAVYVPTRGLSMTNHEGGPFWDPAADRAFVDSLLEAISPAVRVELLDCHINDAAFVDEVTDALVELVTRPATPVLEPEVVE